MLSSGCVKNQSARSRQVAKICVQMVLRLIGLISFQVDIPSDAFLRSLFPFVTIDPLPTVQPILFVRILISKVVSSKNSLFFLIC